MIEPEEELTSTEPATQTQAEHMRHDTSRASNSAMDERDHFFSTLLEAARPVLVVT